MSPLILALDFDGVIADTGKGKRDWIKNNCGLSIPEWASSKEDYSRFIGLHNYSIMQRNVGYEDTLSSNPLDESNIFIKSLSLDFSLFIISSRALEKINWVRSWIDHWGLGQCIEDVICSHGEKKLCLASKISARWLIDNDIRHLGRDKMVESILFRPGSRVCNHTAVNGWRELEAYVRVCADNRVRF